MLSPVGRAPDAPVIRKAASLLLHLTRWDLPAFSQCLAEVQGEAEAKDIITAIALLATRLDADTDSLQEVVLTEALRETM